MLAMGDCSHLHWHIERFERDVAVTFAEGRFRFENRRVDDAFDNDLGVGRHIDVNTAAGHDRYRPPGQTAGNCHFVEIDWELLRAGEFNHRGGTNDDRDLHRPL